MDKVAAYQSGVVEGLKGLHLPQEIKLAAAQYLLKLSSEKDDLASLDPPGAKFTGQSYSAIKRDRDAYLAGLKEPPSARPVLEDSVLQALVSGPGSDDYLALANDDGSFPSEANMDALADRIGQVDGEEAEKLERQLAKMEDSAAAASQAMRNEERARGVGMGAGQRLLRDLRDNPGLAAAAGLGAAGLGYGAYRALS